MSDLDTAISPEHHVTVTASAGVGKTYLLVTRIARLLLEDVRPDAILAITFTRKAATEIYQRLMERLHSWATQADEALLDTLRHLNVPATAAYLTRARTLYEAQLRTPYRVQATTFHAFCQDLLRRFPLDADVPPGFALLDNPTPVYDAAWDALYLEAAQHPQSPVATALEVLFNYTNTIHSTRQALDQMLRQRADWWAYTEDRPAALDVAQARLQALLNVTVDADPIGDFACTQMQGLRHFCYLLALHTTDTNVKHAQTLAHATLREQCDATWYAEIRPAFLTAKGTPLARKSTKAQRKSMGDAQEDEFLRLHAEICAALIRVEDMQKAQLNYHIISHLYRAGARLIEHYQRIKNEQRLIDFADLEWKAYRLLNAGDNAVWVQYKLDQRIDHLLVDEFQDTNPTQWRLLLPLLQEFASGGERLRSAFIVGDAKQSIYRFRRADAGLLATAGAWLDTQLGGARFPMDKSRRSAPAIIELVNRVFSSAAMTALMPDFHPHTTHQTAAWGQVEIWPLLPLSPTSEQPELHWRNPLQTPRTVTIDDRHYADGCRVARHIQQTLAQGIADTHGARPRALDYSDVMILLRARTHAQAYERALRDHHIPCLGIERGTLLATQEAQDIVALLTTLSVPYDNLALAGVLRSPIFACSDDDLIVLASTHSGAHWRDRLTAIAQQMPTHACFQRAQDLLSQWQIAAGLLPVHDLLDNIYCTGDILARYEAAYPAHLGSRVRGNLLQILALALATDSGRYPSLGRFLQELADLRDQEEGAPDIAAPYSGVPSVRILTIHAAKGLEAPLVYLVDSATTSGNERAYRTLVRWPSGAERPDYFGAALKKDDLDPFHRELIAHQGAAQAREEANLLYVAVTRARHQLVITGIMPNNPDTATSWYHRIAAALPWDDCQQTWIARNGATPVAQDLSHASPRQPEILPQVLRLQAPPLAPRLPAQPDTDTRQRLRGRIIHRMLELHGHGTTPQSAAQQTASENRLTTADDIIIRCAAEVAALLELAHIKDFLHAHHAAQTYHELPVSYLRDGVLEHGIVDRLVVTDKKLLIVDYKSDRDVDATRLDAVAASHLPQLHRYAAGLALCWPHRSIEGVLIFTESGMLWRQELNVR
ncbi:MAG: UvrD-helicase domain-containing protein [Pseudomonadota bacterium]